MAPRTIDNLGIDVSTRYATDQQELDRKILKEARGVPLQTEIDVTTPAFSSEFNLLFDVPKRNTPWANFSIPEQYNEQRKRLFTHQVIPSLGSHDKIESQEKRILAKIKERAGQQEKEGRHPRGRTPTELEQEKEEEEKEKEVLIKLLNTLLLLDKCMNDINARRMQYQKG